MEDLNQPEKHPRPSESAGEVEAFIPHNLDDIKSLLSRKVQLAECYEHLRCEFEESSIDPEAKSIILPIWNNAFAGEVLSIAVALLSSGFSVLAFKALAEEKLDAVFPWSLFLAIIFAWVVIYFLSKSVGVAIGALETIFKIREEKKRFVQGTDFGYVDRKVRYEALVPLFTERQRLIVRFWTGFFFVSLSALVELAAFYMVFSAGEVGLDGVGILKLFLASLVTFPAGFLKGYIWGVKYEAKTLCHQLAQIYTSKAELVYESIKRVGTEAEEEFIGLLNRELLKREQKLKEEAEQREKEFDAQEIAIAEERKRNEEQAAQLEASYKEKIDSLEQKHKEEQEEATARFNEEKQKLQEQLKQIIEDALIRQEAVRATDRLQELLKQISASSAETAKAADEISDTLDVSKLEPFFKRNYTVITLENQWKEDAAQYRNGNNSKLSSLETAEETKNGRTASAIRSPIVRAMYTALRNKGIEEDQMILDFKVNVASGVIQVDIGFPREKVAVFCDSKENDFERWKNAMLADRALMAIGWRHMRFSGSEINANVDACAQELLRLLNSGGYGDLSSSN